MPKEKKKKCGSQEAARKAAKSFITGDSKRQDPGGSYTGSPNKRGDIPEQDADDL